MFYMFSTPDMALLYKGCELYRLSLTKNIFKYKIPRFNVNKQICFLGYLKFIFLVDLQT